MSIFLTKPDQHSLRTKVGDILLETFDDKKVIINTNQFYTNGESNQGSIHLRDESDSTQSIKLHNYSDELFWNDRSVVIEGDDTSLNNLEVTGTFTIGGQTYTFPPDNGSHRQVLTSNGDGRLFWRDTGTTDNNLSNLHDTVIDDVTVNDMIKIINVDGEFLWTNTKSLSQLEINDTVIGNITPSNATFTTTSTNDLHVDNDADISGDVIVGGNIQMYGSVIDDNGNTILKVTPTPDAVNYLEIKNNELSHNPIITVNGSDNNLGIDFQVSGDGTYNFYGTSTTPAKICLYENNSNGTSSITIQAPTDIYDSYTLSLPATTGTINQVLKSDGSGGMIWGNGIDSLISNSGENRLVISDGTPYGIIGVSNMTFDETTLYVNGNIKLSGDIYDESSNKLIKFNAIPNAINNLSISNSNLNQNPVISSIGDDTNIGIDFQIKGDGTYNFKSDTVPATLVLHDTTSHTLSIATQELQSNITLTLPPNSGNNNQVLTTDGDGNLEWTNKVTITNDASNKVVISNGASELVASNLECNDSDLTLYVPINDGNPSFSIGGSPGEKLSIQTVFTTGGQSLLKTIFNTPTASSVADRGKYEFNVDDSNVFTIDDDGIIIKNSGTLEIGSSVILRDVSGTTTLNNIDALDAITESTIENAIDTLPNLSSVGTITTGVWNGSTLAVAYGGTGQTSLANNRLLTGNGTNGIVAESNLTFDGSALTLDGTFRINGNICDSNGRELIKLVTTNNAVNEITIANNTTSNNPIISATGNDASIGIDFQTKGNGKYNFKGTSNSAAEIVLSENASSGIHTLSIKAPSSIDNNIVLTFPNTSGSSNQVLTTDGNGSLSWTTKPSLNNDGDNRLITASGSGNINAEANLKFDGTNVTQYVNVNDSNPELRIGSSASECVAIQTIFDNGTRNIDKLLICTKTASNSAHKGKIELNVDDQLIATFNDEGLLLKESGVIEIGNSIILSDSNGTAILSNIDTLDDTTKNTIQNRITSLPNISSVGNITSGTWSGSAIGVQYGGTGATSLATDSLLTGNGTSGITAESTLKYDGVNLRQYVNLDNADPTFSIGSGANERFILQTTYSNSQQLDKVKFITKTDSATANKGQYEFFVDDVSVITIDDSGLILRESGTLEIGSSVILSDVTGNTTLSNIDAIDTTTRTTLQSAITSLSGLTTVGTITAGTWNGSVIGVPHGGTGVTSLTSDSLLTGNGTNGIVAEANLTFNGSFLRLIGSFNLSGNINDSNTNELIKLNTTPGAVNEISISNNTTNNNPIISSSGDDANIGIDFQAKGTGKYRFRATSTSPSELTLFEASNNGTHTLSLKAPSTITSNFSLTFPDNVGINGYNLTSDGNGNLVWSNGITITNAGDNRVLTSNNSGGIDAESNLMFNGTNLLLTGNLYVSGNIIDVNANELLKFTTTAGAVNEITIKNNSSTNNPQISATGNDTNIGLDFQTKGSGKYTFNATSANSSTILLSENTSNGSHTLTVKAPESLTSNTLFVLPNGHGTADQVLTTDGNGNTSWANAGSSLSINNAGDNRILTCNASGQIDAESNLNFDGTSLTHYVATNDGNPSTSIGSNENERLVIQSIYDTGTQTLDKVTFTTKANSLTTDKGKFEFYVDDSLVTTFNDAGVSIKESGSLAFGTVNILTDSSGTTTLNNIDAIDATTRTTLESAITSLSGLTTVGTITSGTWNGSVISPTYGGTGVTSLSDITTLSGLTTVGTITSGVWNGSVIGVTYGGTGVTSLSDITTLSGLTTVGTITSGVWNGSVIGVTYGGTGANTFTTGGLLLGNGTSALSASSNLTYNSSVLNLAASSKLAIGGINIIDDTTGTTTLSNIDALDATTEATIEAAIDTLDNLTSASSLATIGTITSGTWNGSVIGVAHGGTGQNSLLSNAALFGNGIDGIIANSILTYETPATLNLFDTQYGINTVYNIGKSNDDKISIELISDELYNESIVFWSKTGLDPSMGRYPNMGYGAIQFKINEYNVLHFDINGIHIKESARIDFGSSVVLEHNGTDITLSNISIIDATTEATIEAAIDTLDNLTSASSLATVGTITSGIWNGNTIGVAYGGTGQTSLNNNSILTGNGTDGISAESNLTFDGTDLKHYELGYGINPSYSIGKTDNDRYQILMVCDHDFPDYLETVQIKSFTSNSVNSGYGAFIYSINNNYICDIDYNGIDIKSSGRLSLGNTSVLSENTGAITLSNINVIDETTQSTLETTIDALNNLISASSLATVGTITSGTWNGSTIGVAYGGTGQTSLDNNSILTGNGTNGIVAEANLTYDGTDLKQYNSDINQKFSIGSSNNERLLIETINDTNIGDRRTKITTKTDNSSPTNGMFEIYKNDNMLARLYEYGLQITPTQDLGGLIMGNKIVIKCDTSNLITLKQIDDLDEVTLDTFGTKITSLSNLTEVSTVTTGTWNGSVIGVTYGGTGVTSLSDITTLSGLTSVGTIGTGTWNGSVIGVTYGGTGVTSLSDITSLSGLTTVGTIGTGTWNATNIGVAYGGTGAVTFTSGGLLLGNGTSALSASSDLTYSSSILNMAASSKLAIGGINIIDDTSGVTTLSNINAIDSTTNTTISTTSLDSVRLRDGDTNYFQLSASNTMSGNVNCTLPSGVGGIGQSLIVANASGSNMTLGYGSPAFNYSTISSNTTVVVNTIYSCNTSGGTFTVTFPASATVGDYIELIDSSGSFGTNYLMIVAPGSQRMFVNGSLTGVSNLAVTYTNFKVKCTYVANDRWCVEYPNFGSSMKVAILRDEKSNTSHGQTSPSLAWTTRVLNTRYDPDNIVTLSGGTIGVNGTANEFTLQPGKYLLHAKCNAFVPTRTKLRIVDSLNNVVDIGQNGYTIGTNTAIYVTLDGIINITTATTYRLQHYFQTGRATDGMGVSSASTNNVANEIYSSMVITKYDDVPQTNIVSLISQYNKSTLTQANHNLTLTNNTLYYITSASSAFSLIIPFGSAIGDIIEITDGSGSLATNNLTINRAGSDVFVVGDSSLTSFVMNRNGMKLRFEKVNTTRWSLNVNSQDGIWQSYTMTFGATVTAPTKQNVILDSAQYCVIGKSLHIKYDYRQSSASTLPGSGTYLFPLPPGYATNIVLATPVFTGFSYIVGSGFVRRTGAAAFAVVEMFNNTNMRIRHSGGDADVVSSSGYSLNSDQSYSFFATIPLP